MAEAMAKAYSECGHMIEALANSDTRLFKNCMVSGAAIWKK